MTRLLATAALAFALFAPGYACATTLADFKSMSFVCENAAQDGHHAKVYIDTTSPALYLQVNNGPIHRASINSAGIVRQFVRNEFGHNVSQPTLISVSFDNNVFTFNSSTATPYWTAYRGVPYDCIPADGDLATLKDNYHTDAAADQKETADYNGRVAAAEAAHREKEAERAANPTTQNDWIDRFMTAARGNAGAIAQLRQKAAQCPLNVYLSPESECVSFRGALVAWGGSLPDAPRGWIGVNVQSVTRDIANSMGLASTYGALVAAIQKDSPAAQVGIQSGDVITVINGETVLDEHDLANKTATLGPKKTVTLAIIRNGAPMTLDVTLGTNPADRP